MKANELMIGDWVLTYDSTHKEKVQAQIWAIEEGQTSILVKKGITNWFVGIEWIEPIPLTPYILEKNGFVNKKGRFMQKGNFDDPPLIMWHLVDDEIGHPKSQLEIHHGEKSMHVSLVCIYVHELQHALSICGIEKEIEL